MARTAKTTNIENVSSEKISEQATSEKTVRKFESTDLIKCRSLTQGELLMPGKKSDILYRWGSYNDVTDVEYQDLYSLKASRSEYLMKPLFVIEDDDLLADPRWADLKTMYKKLYKSEDMTAFLKLPLQQFKKALRAAPEGYKNALCIEAATQAEAGTFDEMNKIKAIDEICGTDLKSIFY